MDRIWRRGLGGKVWGLGCCDLVVVVFCRWCGPDAIFCLTFSSHWSSSQRWQCEAVGVRISTSKSEPMVLSRKPIDCLLPVGNVSLHPSKGVHVPRGLVHGRGEDGGRVWLENRSNGGGIALALPHSCDEKRVEPEGKALDLPVNLHSYPHRWSWRMGYDWNTRSRV